MDEKKQSSSGLDFRLHPLTMINISDHYTRMRANYPNLQPLRVLGCLLGSQSGRTVDISNSFEMNFNLSDQGVVIDEAFLAKKLEQYKTVFPKQDVVGWYATGAEVQQHDMTVHKTVMELNESPVFLLLDPAIDPARKELPVQLHETELHLVDGEASLEFVRAAYSIETSDAERIGVDQVAKILPSGKASGAEQLSAHYAGLHSAIKMLAARIQVLVQLARHVQAGEVQAPHGLMRQLSSLVHSLPALDSQPLHADFLRETSDSLLAIYLAAMTKGTAALGELADKVMLAYERGAGAGGHHAPGLAPSIMGVGRRRGAMGSMGMGL